MKAAWLQKESFLKQDYNCPTTRNRAKLIVPLEHMNSWNGKMVKSMLVKAWNKLPIELKNTEKLLNFQLRLKEFLFDF